MAKGFCTKGRALVCEKDDKGRIVIVDMVDVLEAEDKLHLHEIGALGRMSTSSSPMFLLMGYFQVAADIEGEFAVQPRAPEASAEGKTPTPHSAEADACVRGAPPDDEWCVRHNAPWRRGGACSARTRTITEMLRGE